MGHQHHRRSTSLVTPFHDFSLRVSDLHDSDLAVNIRRHHASNEIERALARLYDVVKDNEAINGINGPLKPWNMPSSAGTSGLYQQRHSSRPTSPYTPPRTPNISAGATAVRAELQARISDLRQKLDQANELISTLRHDLDVVRVGLANAKKDANRLGDNLSDRNSTIADLREKVARQHQKMERERHSRSPPSVDARRQSMYVNRHADDNHNAAGTSSTRRQSTYHNRHDDINNAQMDGNAPKASSGIRDPRSKTQLKLDLATDTYNDPSLRLKETREAQLILCAVLRETKHGKKIEEARARHTTYSVAIDDLAAMKVMQDNDRDWVFLNALGLSSTLAELGQYKAAVQKLTECERASRLMTPDLQDRLAQTTLVIVDICIDADLPELATSAFELVYPSRRNTTVPNTVPAELLANLGTALFPSSSGTQPTAKRFLQQAYARRRELDKPAQRTVGYLLALAAERQHQWREAESLLTNLPPSSRYVNLQHDQRTQQPTENAVLALLAHVQLHLEEYTSAERHARDLYTKHGIRWRGSFHPANTLIQVLAMSSGDRSQRFQEAHAIWQKIYADIVLGDSNVTDREKWKAKLLGHSDAGEVLAREWTVSCERRGKVARTAEQVAGEVRLLRDMVR
ncbi:uncharacterized protein AB675_7126 [Cyphellophora attinorum]|uniref:Uncharacterized protein n=1 Tax=Cyphellophora attinorum TaxID=1664694 RepID=A0A0N0NQ08_9EURO|nr:uncharacterized protein AB675_7126 [Phialophora attinorum]KPI43358.1 hypothetical protein AB675_7126 [Phialophora attinorum]